MVIRARLASALVCLLPVLSRANEVVDAASPDASDGAISRRLQGTEFICPGLTRTDGAYNMNFAGRNLRDADWPDIAACAREASRRGPVRLILRNQRFDSVPPNTFRGSNKIRELDLTSSNIRIITPGSFNGLDNCVLLNLTANKIARVRGGSFKGMPKLRVLSLGNRRLTAVDSGAFNRLVRLRTLDLSGSGLTVIKRGVFKGTPDLRELNLSECAVDDIWARAFSTLGQLRSLDLRRNNLGVESITAATFAGLVNLETLDISRNKGIQFACTAFRPLGELTEILVAGTGLKCRRLTACGDYSPAANCVQ